MNDATVGLIGWTRMSIEHRANGGTKRRGWLAMRWRPWRKAEDSPSSAAHELGGGDGELSSDRPQEGEPSTAPLSADEPIRSAAEDLLGRASFANALANTVERAPRGAGFVIAVTGPWGDGKTSVLNMAVERLEARASVDIVRFNPWLFSGADDLLARFFTEVAAQLPSEGPTSAVSSGLRRYAGAVAPFRSLPWLGGVLQTTGELASGAAELMAPDAVSAHDRAHELRSALEKLDRAILVVVDDIDRLRPDEVADVMRLVRLVGDFPNLIYVLAFDRARVEEALGGGREQRELGAEYLEKIVQAVFEMPEIRADARERVLLQALSKAIGDTTDLTFSQDTFANVYGHGLGRLFRSLRDVRRVANALPATLEILEDEIEVSDVVALEALRLLEPGAFEVLASAPGAFTTTSPEFGIRRNPAIEEQHRAAVELALERARRRQEVRELVEELFPAARRLLGGASYGGSWEATWRLNRRVASREVLDIYLMRGIASGGLPQSFVRSLMAVLEDRPILNEMLKSLDPERLELLLNRLEDYDGRLDDKNPHELIGALLDQAKRLRTGRRDFYDMGADMALGRALLRLLRGRDPDLVETIVESVETDSLWGRYELLMTVGHVEGAGSRLVAPEAASRLERVLVDDLLEAPADRLLDERDLAAILGVARRIDEDALRARLETWLNDARFVQTLLTSAVLEATGGTPGRAGVVRRYQLSWRALASMAGEERLAEAVRTAAPLWEHDQLSERDEVVLNQALEYADDPSSAETDLGRWGTRFDDDADG